MVNNQLVYAVWGWYPGGKEDGLDSAVLSVHATEDGATEWARSHRITDEWIYVYTVENP